MSTTSPTCALPPKILIGTPCYNGSVSIEYLKSLLKLIDLLGIEQVGFGLCTPSHESLITRARNYIANDFLRQKDYTHLLFIDADLEFPAAPVLHYLRADKDVVCGIYPVKNLDLATLRRLPPEVVDADAQAASLKYAVKVVDGRKVQPDGLLSVEYGATGFMLIKRAILERLAAAHPELRYRYAFINSNDCHKDNYAFFDTAIDPETRDYLPEDYAFCRRVAAVGGEVYADIFSRFTHVGTRGYTGDFATFLEHLHLTKPELAETIEEKCAKNQDPS